MTMENKKVCSVKQLCHNESCITCRTRSFASHEKSEYWSDENGEIKPRNVFKGTHTKYWFNCNKKHPFLMSPHHITSSGTWCPECNRINRKIQFSYDSTSLIKFCQENGITLKKDYKLLRINRDSRILGNCLNIITCNNTFEKFFRMLVRYGGYCNKCTTDIKRGKLSFINREKNKLIPYENSLASHDKSRCFSKKNVDKNEILVNTKHIPLGTDDKFIFDCDCGHEFDISIYHLKEGKWCPYCSNPQKKLCGKEDCNRCFNQSFASNIEKVKYWNYDKNDELPKFVSKNGDKMCWFDCNICKHSFETRAKSITDDVWCPYCSEPSKILCNNNECNHCFNRSFASNIDKSKYWIGELNGDIKPRDVFKSTAQKFWFRCEVCKHSFETSLNNINGGGWCSYCCGHQLCENINCDYCFNYSFASHHNAIYWSNENKLKPREVRKFCNKMYYFICKEHGNYLQIPVNGCPQCVNKTETKLFEQLSLYYPSLVKQLKVEWCKNITHLPFDFCIEEYKIIIELDGAQHFIQVSNWKSPEDTQERDTYKMKCANENGYSMIRIIQEDVWDDKYEWLEELKENIEKIKNECIVQNIFMCNNNEYNEIILSTKK